MERIDFVKRHQSHGCYKTLVDRGNTAFAQGHAPSVKEGVRAACLADPAKAELAIAGPQDPQWAYMPVIKDAMGYVDREALQASHINTAYRLNPTFARQVGRGDFMQPASVQKAAPDPLPTGQTAAGALLAVAKGYIAQGVDHGEAHTRAAHEHPTWYAQHAHQAPGR